MSTTTHEWIASKRCPPFSAACHVAHELSETFKALRLEHDPAATFTQWPQLDDNFGTFIRCSGTVTPMWFYTDTDDLHWTTHGKNGVVHLSVPWPAGDGMMKGPSSLHHDEETRVTITLEGHDHTRGRAVLRRQGGSATVDFTYGATAALRALGVLPPSSSSS